MFEFVLPSINRFGKGCVSSIGTLIKETKGKKALIVTDHNLVSLGVISPVISSLEEANIKYTIYDSVKQNPTKENVIEGTRVYKDQKCDLIIGIGGGSPNDCAKAIGMMVSNGGEIEQYVGFNQSEHPSPRLFMVNTIAGTASEISRAFLISDEVKQEKLIFKDIHTLPFASFNDPDLMMGLPTSITASTGMDALTHAIESYVSTGKYPLTQSMSIASISFILKSLPKVVQDPHNTILREELIYAQSLAGMSFCNSGLGLVHSMAHQLGGVYNLPHGLCNAILLPYVMTFNQSVALEDYASIANAVAPFDTQHMTVEEASQWLIDSVIQLSETIGTRRPLKELGVREEDIVLLSEKTLLDGNLPRNPVQPTQEEIESIFKLAL